jgi:hypothetical protein
MSAEEMFFSMFFGGGRAGGFPGFGFDFGQPSGYYDEEEDEDDYYDDDDEYETEEEYLARLRAEAAHRGRGGGE